MNCFNLISLTYEVKFQCIMFLKPVYTSNKKEQFYKIIRPLSLILKCLGFFPFQNCSSNDGLQLGYDKMTSYIHLILTLLAFTVPSLYVILNAKQNFVMLSESVLAITYVICILNCFLTDHLLLETIHKYEYYDEFYIKSKHTVICNRLRYRGFISFVITIFLILFDVNFIEHIVEYKVLQTAELIEFVWMQVVQSAPWLAMIGGFYVQLCWELWIRFSELRQTISPSNLTAPKIEEARLMHGQLKDIHDMINSCFGFRLSLFSLYFLHSFLHLFYKVVVISKKVTLLALSAEIKRFIILHTICYSSEFAVIQVSGRGRYKTTLD